MEEARRSLLATLLLALAALLLLAGCSTAPRATFVDENKSYTLGEVDKLAPGIQAGGAARVSVENAADVRQRVLSELRGHGKVAGDAADFMTQQFPAVTKSVPYYIESAKVDGHASWVILEAWGGRSGDLVFRRLWVFDRETGAVLDARTYR